MKGNNVPRRPNTKLRLYSAETRKDPHHAAGRDQHDEEPEIELRSRPAVLAAHEAHLGEVGDCACHCACLFRVFATRGCFYHLYDIRSIAAMRAVSLPFVCRFNPCR